MGQRRWGGPTRGAHQLLHVGGRGLHFAPQLVVQREHQEGLLGAESWAGRAGDGATGAGVACKCLPRIPHCGTGPPEGPAAGDTGKAPGSPWRLEGRDKALLGWEHKRDRGRGGVSILLSPGLARVG